MKFFVHAKEYQEYISSMASPLPLCDLLLVTFPLFHDAGAMVAVVLVINLTRRHPNCKVLLHRSNPEGQQAS